MKMMHRLSAAALAAVMAISMTSVAFASDGSPTDAVSLENMLEAGGEVTLGQNITISTNQDIVITKPVTLDLNGCTIEKTYEGLNDFIFVINGGSLTIVDSKGRGKIKSADYGIQLRGSNSSFELISGTIETTKVTVDIYDSVLDSTVKISGGALKSTEDSVLGIRGNGGIKVDITGGEMESNGRTGVYVSSYTPDAIEFNFSGGKLSHNGGMSGAIQAYKGATINVSGDAEIVSESSDGVQVQSDVELNVSGGKIEGKYTGVSVEDTGKVMVSDGHISGSFSGIDADETSEVEISGGEISGRDAIVADGSAKITVSGGKVDGSSSAIKKENGGSATITVTGGDFNGKDIGEFIPDKAIAAPTVKITISDKTLTAVAEHPLVEATFAYQWYKGESKLENETNNTLTVDEYATYKVEVVAVYNDISSETVTEEYKYDETPIIPPNPEEPDDDKPSRDNDDSDYYGVEKWDEVKRQITDAEEGDTIKVSATGLPHFPSSVARELKGKDITLEIRKNGVTYKVNGLEIGAVDKVWYEFENIEEQLLTAGPEEDKADEKPQDGNTIKDNPSTGR